MPDDDHRREPGLKAKAVPRIADVPAAAWDLCANPDAGRFNPFVAHGFLAALEEAGCVGGRTGWRPRHVILEDDAGTLLGAAPAYLKSHSQGEYVFDHGWADAYGRAGGRYYPKLLVAVPFSPVPGPRLLVPTGAEHDLREAQLASALVTLAEETDASSLHVTFLDEACAARLSTLGFLVRSGQQFHWRNAGYGSFDDFLATFASRKRKAVRKEREQAVSNGITVERVTGADITEAHWDAMYAFYIDTGSRKWGQPYLNREFFSLLGAALADRCLLVLAKRGGRLIAGALNLVGGDCLYGRYWGSIEQHPSLHFELCYYQAIAYAIEHGLARVEAGAQGEHKLARGYLPATTYSAHWIPDPGFRKAVERFLVHERAAVLETAALYTEAGPFRKVASDAEREEHD
ncbi:MAG: GNAT family N-acetyltransferase [Hyphomicrobiaceae bacterium]